MVEQVDTPAAATEPARVSGDVNMWVFVIGDLVFFAAYFVIFMVYRIHERDLFLESQRHLSVTAAAINTLVLLTSSRFVALAVHAVRAAEFRRATRLIAGGGGLGVMFLVIKLGEWATEISHGFTLPHNNFWMFYYMLTGVHMFHVVLGLIVLGFVVYDLREANLRRVWVVEAGATYWHMVDVLWIVIFALLYVMR
jgi:nitric oxide reductase NorE protein